MLHIHQNPCRGLAKTVGFICLPKDKPISGLIKIWEKKRSFHLVTDLFPTDPPAHGEGNGDKSTSLAVRKGQNMKTIGQMG